MSFGFTQTGLKPGMTMLTESPAPYISTSRKRICQLRRGLSKILFVKLLTGATGLAHDGCPAHGRHC